MIAARHSALHDLWGTMDGKKVTIEAAGDFMDLDLEQLEAPTAAPTPAPTTASPTTTPPPPSPPPQKSTSLTAPCSSWLIEATLTSLSSLGPNCKPKPKLSDL